MGGKASADWSNYCQAGWKPFEACTVGPPTAGDQRIGTYGMIRGYGNDAPAGESLVVSFTNTGCTATSSPIQVYWAFWSTKGDLQAWQVGSIGPTRAGKTSSFAFVVPPPPDATGWSGGLRIAFSWQDTRHCTDYAPAYTGTWKLSSGKPPLPLGRVTLAGGPSFDIDAFSRGRYGSVASGGGKAVESSDFLVGEKADATPAELFRDNASGKVFPLATIVVYKPGTTTVELRFTLEKATIASAAHAAGSPATDTFVLSGRLRAS